MQGSRSGSTLELAVNEQQLTNMSQMNLNSSPGFEINQNNQQNQQTTGGLFSLDQAKRWPTRFRDSFSAKLNEAKSKSETRTEYVFEVIYAFSGVVIWLFCFLFTIVLPIILFFIGLFTLDDCANRPSLPYLVFAVGFVMTASNLFNLAMTLDWPILTNHKLLSSDLKNTIASILNIIFNCIVVFLYILIAYMVFTLGNRRRTFDSNETSAIVADNTDILATECNRTLYYSTFWLLSLTLGLIAILGLVAIVLYAYNRYRLNIIRGSTPRSQTVTNLSCQTNPAFMSSTNRL